MHNNSNLEEVNRRITLTWEKFWSCGRKNIIRNRKIHKVRSEEIRQGTKLTDSLKQALTVKWAAHIDGYRYR